MTKIYIKVTIVSILIIGKLSAQTINTGDLSIAPNTEFSTLFNFDNKTNGDLLIDGDFIAYANFNNDGLVTYTNSSNGKTYFIGTQKQLISGTQTAHFQNVIFENTSELVPFHLNTIINIGKNVEFKKGIIDADSYNGKMVFEQNAFHTDASNLSFVDGKVENVGNLDFEFPVGDQFYFRPSYHDKGANANNVYTTQYFFENAGSLHPYTNKEDTILSIDEAEYWNLTQDQGAEKIILSLTLDTHTTPASFFVENPDTELGIVRWDDTTLKWVNEGGTTTDLLTGADYSKLVTTQVGGYGLFTIAIVKKTITPDSDLIIYNAVSPNGDGINDSFYIKGINKYPDNRVEIYNRWGVKVYDATSYNENDVMFKGYSDGRSTVKRGEGLPAGTYFYVLKYNKNNTIIENTGYLYIANDK
ncbi:gliding motility-associated C-terminal domain-containing protein [Flavobacterium sp. CFBP9031]|uniref:gliding motility-associated C-terminal domain-containing protein n=1 Tax=Flavobacterium sp. CFBP9031 TaxID=3096538 RepID=UPI002A6AE36D|nr:gliding motility-associated C-terminal domain-containing protein [Flavobacterium sp. CFBP9031]MDY0989466.1 gliding motility-associated C-terminal domain-containing protein [Flavobacterium sp. CFBP9031]